MELFSIRIQRTFQLVSTGKSKRAERSIGFSPLIPAKQVHTGGNPFFISVTDIHTVSFGNNLLYLLAGYILL